jgi:hypothetical protein
MKLEQLASLLGKMQRSYKVLLILKNQADVPDEILTRELTNFTKELSITKSMKVKNKVKEWQSG